MIENLITVGYIVIVEAVELVVVGLVTIILKIKESRDETKGHKEINH